MIGIKHKLLSKLFLRRFQKRKQRASLSEIIRQFDKGTKILDLGSSSNGSWDYEEGQDITMADKNPIKKEGLAMLRSVSCDSGVNAEDLPYESNSFDVIVLYTVLEYILLPHKALSEISRVMSPNGILFISSNNLNSITRRISGCLESEHNTFSKKSFVKMLESLNFKILNIEMEGFWFVPLKSRIMIYIKCMKNKTINEEKSLG